MERPVQSLVGRDFRRILAVDFSLVGDLVMLTPALAALKQAYPQAQLALAAQPFAGELFASPELVDEVIPYAKRGRDRQGVWRLAARLRYGGFDAAFIFHKSFGSAFACWLARIPVRVGYRHEWRDRLLTHRVKLPELEQHIVAENLHLLAAVGLPVAEGALAVYPDVVAREHFFRLLRPQVKLNGLPTVVVCPHGGWPTKNWSTANISRFLDLFPVNSVTFVVVGAQGEEAYAERIYSVNNEVLNLVGKTTLRELIYILEEAQVVVSPDTSVIHLAAVVGTPVVALFGPTSPKRSGPRPQARATVLTGNVNCLRCYLKRCHREPFCMNTIEPEQVKRAVERHLVPQSAGSYRTA